MISLKILVRVEVDGKGINVEGPQSERSLTQLPGYFLTFLPFAFEFKLLISRTVQF